MAASGLLALALAGCGSDDGLGAGDGASEAPSVIATTTIWTDITGNVACEDSAVVTTLVPAGVDPHAFEPSLADRAELGAAALVVANGHGLEEGLEDALRAVEADGTAVVRMADGMSESRDPHVWFDPRLVADSLPALADRLIDDVGLDPDMVQLCLLAYQEELLAVDEEIEALVAQLPVERRKLVTNHDSLGYFAERYGFEVIGTVLPGASTMVETNPAALEGLAESIEQTGVPAIFVEIEHSSDDAEALASRLGGVEIVPLRTGALGGPGSGADTYISFLRSNAVAITESLD